LWTAAREQLPVVFAVVNNQQYLILKRFLRSNGPVDNQALAPMLDLVDPPVSYVGLAESLGVPAVLARSAKAAEVAVREAWGAPHPTLIEIPIATVD
jgi:thiamine pyrophosphate-dependent acetolactate synthase large subunit-like protein